GGLGSGNAFAVGEPAISGDGTRSDGGESTEGEADQPECEEERSDGRGTTGTAGASGSEAVVADPAPRGGSASGPGGDPCASGTGGKPDGADQHGARAGEADGR